MDSPSRPPSAREAELRDETTTADTLEALMARSAFTPIGGKGSYTNKSHNIAVIADVKDLVTIPGHDDLKFDPLVCIRHL